MLLAAALCCVWGSVASWAVSLNSAYIPAGVVDPLGLTFHLCSDWSWAGCSHIHWPAPSLLPVLSRVAAPQSPLASVSKSCNGAKPHTLVVQSRNAVAAMPKCCLPCDGKVWASTLTASAWVRFSLSAFNWVASSIHGAVQEPNKVHKTAGFQRTVFYWLCLGHRCRAQCSYSTTFHCSPKDPLSEGEGILDLAGIQCPLSQGTLTSIRALLYLPLILSWC